MEDTVSELLDLARLDETPGGTPLASLPEVDLDELVLDETVQPHRVLLDTTACRPAVSTGAASSSPVSCATCSTTPTATRDQSRSSSTTDSDTGIVELVVDDDGPGSRPRTASGSSSQRS